MAIEITGPAPAAPASSSESWGDFLDSDETLLWHGAPAAGLRFRGKDMVSVMSGVLLLGYVFIWSSMAAALSAVAEIGQGMGMASGITPGLLISSSFALPFFAIGGYLVIGRPLLSAYRRRHTRYALTDRRAIVARSAFARSLRSYPIDPDTQIDYHPGAAATIWFAEEQRRGAKGQRYTVRHGFEFIRDGDAVYRLMRQIQLGEKS